jgi:hypothetical protein
MPLRRRLRVMAVRQTKITTPTAINKPIGISATITQIICSPPVVPYSDTYNGTNRALIAIYLVLVFFAVRRQQPGQGPPYLRPHDQAPPTYPIDHPAADARAGSMAQAR